jgi:hypothetical protein
MPNLRDAKSGELADVFFGASRGSLLEVRVRWPLMLFFPFLRYLDGCENRGMPVCAESPKAESPKPVPGAPMLASR